MYRYDPDIPPDAAQWLELDELDRIAAVEEFHRARKIAVPNLSAHAAFHVVVENQLAEQLEYVQRALIRLMGQRLSRHEAIHAISSVLIAHLNEEVQSKAVAAEALEARYKERVERLTAASWRREFGRSRRDR